MPTVSSNDIGKTSISMQFGSICSRALLAHFHKQVLSMGTNNYRFTIRTASSLPPKRWRHCQHSAGSFLVAPDESELYLPSHDSMSVSSSSSIQAPLPSHSSGCQWPVLVSGEKGNFLFRQIFAPSDLAVFNLRRWLPPPILLRPPSIRAPSATGVASCPGLRQVGGESFCILVRCGAACYILNGCRWQAHHYHQLKFLEK